MSVSTKNIITCLNQTLVGSDSEILDAIRRANRYRHAEGVTWQELFDIGAEGGARYGLVSNRTKQSENVPKEDLHLDIPDGPSASRPVTPGTPVTEDNPPAKKRKNKKAPKTGMRAFLESKNRTALNKE